MCIRDRAGAHGVPALSAYPGLVAFQQQDRHVVGQLAAVQLLDLGDRGLQQRFAAQPLVQPAVDHGDHAVLAEPLGSALPDAPLYQPVGVHHQAPGAAELHLAAGPPRVRQQTEGRAAVLVREEVRRPSLPGDQRCRMSRDAQPGAAAVGGDVDGAERREDLLALPFVLQDLLQRGEQVVAAEPGQRQRAPRDAQLDAERRLVRAVPADVADHRVDRAVGGADRVVEVAAQQGTAAARPVVGGERQVGAVEERGRQQPAFQSGVLLGAQPGLGQLVLGDVRAFALHGVPDGTAEEPPVELAAKEVVLGPDAYGLGRALRVVLRGEGEHGMTRCDAQDVFEGGELVRPAGLLVAAVGAGAGGQRGRLQVEVEQDAVDVVGEQPAGLGEIACGTDADPCTRGGRQLGDGEGARRVVLDHQECEVGAMSGLRSGNGTLLRYGYGHRFGFPSLPRGRGGSTNDEPPTGTIAVRGGGTEWRRAIIVRHMRGHKPRPATDPA